MHGFADEMVGEGNLKSEMPVASQPPQRCYLWSKGAILLTAPLILTFKQYAVTMPKCCLSRGKKLLFNLN